MLVSKDESLKLSMVNVGYHILRCLEKQENERATLSQIAVELRKREIKEYRPLVFGLTFLFSIDAIAFEPPYFYTT